MALRRACCMSCSVTSCLNAEPSTSTDLTYYETGPVQDRLRDRRSGRRY